LFYKAVNIIEVPIEEHDKGMSEKLFYVLL